MALTPLPQNRPHVACILLWYPLFTQPFIFQEVEGLRAHLPIAVHSLYGRHLRCCSSAMLVAAPRTKRLGPRALPLLLRDAARQCFRSPRRFFRLFRRCLCRRWPSWEVFGENLWAFFAGCHLAYRFREDGMDFIYAPWPRGTATAALVASAFSGIPFATSARGDNLEPADPDLAFKLRGASFIRANNAADKARIEALPGARATGKTHLVYNSLTLPSAVAPAFTSFHTPPRLFAIGRFDVTKGFDVLLRACALLRDRGVSFRLTLAGGGGKALGLGDMGDRLHILRRDLGLETLVTMPGLVSHDALPDLLRAQDIFLAPCVIDAATGMRDGIPNTVIEALSFGLPVIATTVNALPEIVRHEETGLAVPPGDPEALADAVQRLLASPDEARRLASAGFRLARDMFSPDANARRLADLFLHAGDRPAPQGTPSCVA
mgnify:FL=1